MAKGVISKEAKTRLTEVSEEVQNNFNIGYREGRFLNCFRFERGAPVIFCSGGFYLRGTIISYYRSCVPEGLYSPETLVGIDRQVPTYIIGKDEWKLESNEEIPENELIARTWPTEDLGAIFGMLYAHEYNLDQLGRKRKALPGIWILNDTTIYKEVETKWQSQTGNVKTFKDYCAQ